MKILVVEDEPKTGEYLRQGLTEAGYVSDLVPNGADGLHLALQGEYDLVILDVMLPGLNGWQVLQSLRDRGLEMPVLFLTARDQVEDRVKGLELGADDYLVKPVDPTELMARIKAVFRRYTASAEDSKVLELPDLRIDLERYAVTCRGEHLIMPPKELELLFFLASHPNQVFTREQLLDRIWGFDYVGESRTVDVHIKRLREKLPEQDAWEIKTVWGVGYKFSI